MFYVMKIPTDLKQVQYFQLINQQKEWSTSYTWIAALSRLRTRSLAGIPNSAPNEVESWLWEEHAILWPETMVWVLERYTLTPRKQSSSYQRNQIVFKRIRTYYSMFTQTRNKYRKAKVSVSGRPKDFCSPALLIAILLSIFIWPSVLYIIDNV